MSHYDMDDGYTCPECGEYDGYHDYTKHKSGTGELGGTAIRRSVFYIFCIFGIIVGIACPPLCAMIIAFGAWITGV